MIKIVEPQGFIFLLKTYGNIEEIYNGVGLNRFCLYHPAMGIINYISYLGGEYCL